MWRRITATVVTTLAFAACGDAIGVAPEPDSDPDPDSGSPWAGSPVQATFSVRAELEPHAGFDRWTFRFRLWPGRDGPAVRAANDTLRIDGRPYRLWATGPSPARFALIELEIPPGSAHRTPIRIDPPSVEGLELPSVTVAGFSRRSGDTLRHRSGTDLVLPLGVPSPAFLPDTAGTGWGVAIGHPTSPVRGLSGRGWPPSSIRIPGELLPRWTDPYPVHFGFGREWVLRSADPEGWAVPVELEVEQAWTVVNR